MKKFICVLIILCMIVPVATAEDLSSFVAKWNYWNKNYNSVILSEEIATVDGESWVFTGDNWRMVFNQSAGEYESIGIYAEDFETLVANSAAMGMMVVGDASKFSEFLGYLVRMYFDAKAGNNVIPFMYGLYTYTVSQIAEGYMLTFTRI